MSASLLLVHGDDGFGIDRQLAAFAARLGAVERVDMVPERSPDEALIERVGLESATVGMFGAHLVVLRQPLRAAGRSGSGADRLLELVRSLPDGAALALAEERPSRDVGKPPALLRQLAEAVRERDGEVIEKLAPRRRELTGWIVRHATEGGIGIEPRAAALLAERLGGGVWETDIERGEQTRLADAELRKLSVYAGERSIRPDDVEALVADTRPSSVFAISNALDRREPAAAAAALARGLDEGQPVLRIMAGLQTRVSDLISTRDLLARGASRAELTRRLGRGNARAAERVIEAARRYSGEQLEAMLIGLFEADLAIKRNDVDPESAVSAWLGEHLLATRGGAGAESSRRRPG
jgi:DNA polymerase III delta subunit